jgi:WhiB family redox-sensing transcriptional regulator
VRSDWWKDAACKDDPAPECWFAGRNVADRMRALKVCFGCPVRNECLSEELAILNVTEDQPRGVRGGRLEQERRAMVS